MLRTLATVAASSAAFTAFALPAAASPVTPTAIVGFASSVNTVAYQQLVTFTGQLVDAHIKRPVPNEPVQIQMQPSCQEKFVSVATGTTGSDGHFTITTAVPSGGYVSAVFTGDTGLAPAQSPGGMLLQAAHVPSRLVLDPVPASVQAGMPATFSGTMQVQVKGVWQPFQGAALTLTKVPYTSSQPNLNYGTTSGADGRFSLIEPVTETSEWHVGNSLDGIFCGDSFPVPATASYKWISGVSKTRIAAFSLPSHDEAHHAYYQGMYTSGMVQRWNGAAWVSLAYGGVDYYYRPKGSRTWRKDYSAQTDQYGSFSSIVGIHLGTVEWQARVRPAADTLTSTSTNTVTSTVTDQTHFVSADANRRSSGSLISGQVTDWYNGQVSFSTLQGFKLNLYYRARGSKTWHKYQIITIGRDGFFQTFVTKSYGYSFKIVFPAQSGHQSCTSRTL